MLIRGYLASLSSYSFQKSTSCPTTDSPRTRLCHGPRFAGMNRFVCNAPTIYFQLEPHLTRRARMVGLLRGTRSTQAGRRPCCRPPVHPNASAGDVPCMWAWPRARNLCRRDLRQSHLGCKRIHRGYSESRREKDIVSKWQGVVADSHKHAGVF
ncbi:hypothetical protein EI94DRAFT_1739180 [Lactarius quietus]|nr:hypothetical protein EI94DRAFT_1739180 [Lactarius quietus]